MARNRLGEGVTGVFAPALVLATMAVAMVGPAVAQLDQAKSTELQNTEAGAAAQTQIDRLDDDRANIESDYRQTIAQLENLREYNAQLTALINSQESEMASLREQIDRITGIERDIVPLMNRMLDSLGQFVELDIPFLIEERRSRVTRLRALMTQADATNAEKYRRILEAYQIENDYGRTIEAYEGFVGEGDNRKEVNFLKVGRVTFIYQTRDGSESYVWNADAGGWEQLAGNYRTPVTIAIRMAKEQIPPDLIVIPVKGPSAGEAQVAFN